MNLKLVLKFLSYPFILKPLIFILVVIVTPGIDSAMFYYNSNVLHFTSTELANIGVLSQIGTIFGQQLYRFCFKKYSFRTTITISTVLFSAN